MMGLGGTPVHPPVQSLSVALTREAPRAAPPAPTQPIVVRTALGETIPVAPVGGVGRSFELAARRMLREEPSAMADRYPELFHWRDAVDEARGG